MSPSTPAAPQRGATTGWIQTTATIGLLLSLLVMVLGVRTLLGEAAFADWGWQVPFGLSALMLSLSLWLRLSLTESPAFRRMQQEGVARGAALASASASGRAGDHCYCYCGAVVCAGQA